MNKKTKALAISVGILVLLVGALYGVSTYTKTREEENKVRYDTLFDLTAEKIRKIEWETADGTKYAFARKDGIWKYEYDESFAADQEAVNMLSSGMTGVSVYQTMEDVTDLAQYGLDAPSYKVAVTDREGNTTTAFLGNNNETAGSVYAMYEGDPRTVFSVQPSIKAALEKTLEDFREVSDSSVAE